MSTEPQVTTHECAELGVVMRDRSGADISSRFFVERTTAPDGAVSNRFVAKPESTETL